MNSNAKWKNFLEKIDPGTPTTIENYLIRPTQQIVRYPMLWQECLKVTDERSVTYAEIQALLKKLGRITAGINQKKGLYESYRFLVELVKNLRGFVINDFPFQVSKQSLF